MAQVAAFAMVAALPACGRFASDSDSRPAGVNGDVLALSFEDAPEPGVFVLQADAVRDEAEGAGGLWAAVEDLDRPERAEAVNLETGKAVVVALYRASRPGGPIRLSNEAADALGVGEGPVNVRITALRRKPVVATR